MAKFVAAFGPNQSYYFGNRQRSVWHNVPQALGNLLRDDPKFSPPKLSWVSLGPNSSYFIKSSEAWGYGGISPAIESHVATLGGWKSVNWIQFTHDPDAYLILDVNGQLYSRGLGQNFHDAILRYAFHGFKDICLGLNGGFALSTNNSMVTFAGMSEEFSKAWQSGDVLQVTTSAFDQFYFIEFKDGRSAYLCPNDWHAAIDELRNAVLPAAAPAAVGTVAAQEQARHEGVMGAIGSMDPMPNNNPVPIGGTLSGTQGLTAQQALEYRRHETAMAIISNIGASSSDPPYRPGPPNTTPANIEFNRHRIAMNIINSMGGGSTNDRRHNGYNWTNY